MTIRGKYLFWGGLISIPTMQVIAAKTSIHLGKFDSPLGDALPVLLPLAIGCVALGAAMRDHPTRSRLSSAILGAGAGLVAMAIGAYLCLAVVGGIA